MKSLILIPSPNDAGVLGVTLQSLFVTGRYNQFDVCVGLRAIEVDETETLAKSAGCCRVEKMESLSGFVQNNIWAEDFEQLILVPPGCIFLQEGWINAIDQIFTEDEGKVFLASHWEDVWFEEKMYHFPSVSGLIVVRSEFLQGEKRVLEVPSVGIGAYLYERARSTGKFVGQVPDGIIYTYPSVLPVYPLDELESQWKRTLETVEGKDVE